MTEITGDLFHVHYDSAQSVVTLSGTLRLNGLVEYEPVAALLRTALEDNEVLTLDLRALEFLNSSGIAMLSKFVIEARQRQGGCVTVLGSREVAWQGRSLVNLQRLMPSLTLDFS
ncbi:slr1659 superfamily regulator [Pararhodospirillum photometricum]|nr:STAS domain-containing protein [Pararhodospirillum photometricum]